MIALVIGLLLALAGALGWAAWLSFDRARMSGELVSISRLALLMLRAPTKDVVEQLAKDHVARMQSCEQRRGGGRPLRRG